MLFGKHINKYYFKYSPWLLLGILSLVLVDYMQLVVPELYRTVINGINNGYAIKDGVTVPFDMNFLLDENSRYIYNKKYGKTKALVLFYNALMGKKEMEEL